MKACGRAGTSLQGRLPSGYHPVSAASFLCEPGLGSSFLHKEETRPSPVLGGSCEEEETAKELNDVWWEDTAIGTPC